MNKILLVTAAAVIGFSSAAFAGGIPEEMPQAQVATASASDTGIYLGLEGGLGLTHYKNLRGRENADSVDNDNGIVGRIFVGYDINKYFGVETGYTYFGNQAKFKDSMDNTLAKAQTQAVDLVGKIKAPVVENFSLYAKAGVNYLFTHLKDVPSEAGDIKKNRNNFNVTYGVGGEYSITPNVIANLEWLRFNGNNDSTSDKYQPNPDAFMIGLRYKFNI